MKTSPPSDLSQPFGCLSRLQRTAAVQRTLGLPRWRGAASFLALWLLANPALDAGVFCNPGPSDKSVYEGQVAIFTVTPDGGTPPYSFRWEKNGAEMPGQTTACCTTPPVTAADSGAVGIPRLHIEYSGNRAVLSWPTAAQDFHLITSPDLDDPNSWEPVRLPVWTLGDENKVTTVVVPGPHFYRLRKP